LLRVRQTGLNELRPQCFPEAVCHGTALRAWEV
jgi:hypothetical protein